MYSNCGYYKLENHEDVASLKIPFPHMNLREFGAQQVLHPLLLLAGLVGWDCLALIPWEPVYLKYLHSIGHACIAS